MDSQEKSAPSDAKREQCHEIPSDLVSQSELSFNNCTTRMNSAVTNTDTGNGESLDSFSYSIFQMEDAEENDPDFEGRVNALEVTLADIQEYKQLQRLHLSRSNTECSDVMRLYSVAKRYKTCQEPEKIPDSDMKQKKRKKSGILLKPVEADSLSGMTNRLDPPFSNLSLSRKKLTAVKNRQPSFIKNEQNISTANFVKQVVLMNSAMHSSLSCHQGSNFSPSMTENQQESKALENGVQFLDVFVSSERSNH